MGNDGDDNSSNVDDFDLTDVISQDVLSPDPGMAGLEDMPYRDAVEIQSMTDPNWEDNVEDELFRQGQ